MLKTQALPDIQQEDSDIKITKVGVRNVKVPIVYEKSSILATCAVYSKALEKRGSNMSRYVEILTTLGQEELTLLGVQNVAKAIEASHELDCLLKIKFPIWQFKESPVTKHMSFSSYICEIIYDSKSGPVVGIESEINTVCPCSLAMSKTAAHNQRAICNIKVSVHPTDDLHAIIEALCEVVNKSGSYEIFNVLKRQDEKFVTEEMYKNPKFVEDSVRGTVRALREKKFEKFSVVVESLESIHQHNALSIYDTDTNLHAI